jgi:hypothetical protein
MTSEHHSSEALTGPEAQAQEYIARFRKGALSIADLSPERLGNSLCKDISEHFLSRIPDEYKKDNPTPDTLARLWSPAPDDGTDESEQANRDRTLSLAAYLLTWEEGSEPLVETTGQPVIPDTMNEPQSIESSEPLEVAATETSPVTIPTSEKPLENIQPETKEASSVETPEVTQERMKHLNNFVKGFATFCTIVDDRSKRGYTTEFVSKESLRKIYLQSQALTTAFEQNDTATVNQTLEALLADFNTFGTKMDYSGVVREDLGSLRSLEDSLLYLHGSLGAVYRTYHNATSTPDSHQTLEIINRLGHRIDRAHNLVKEKRSRGTVVLRY